MEENFHDVDISIGSSHAMFLDFADKKPMGAKFIPKLLNLEKKNRCYGENLNCQNQESQHVRSKLKVMFTISLNSNTIVPHELATRLNIQ